MRAPSVASMKGRKQQQQEPRLGTKRRALWDLLREHMGEWIEFEVRDYAKDTRVLFRTAETFRYDYGMEIECIGKGSGLAKWRMSEPQTDATPELANVRSIAVCIHGRC